MLRPIVLLGFISTASSAAELATVCILQPFQKLFLNTDWCVYTQDVHHTSRHGHLLLYVALEVSLSAFFATWFREQCIPKLS